MKFFFIYAISVVAFVSFALSNRLPQEKREGQLGERGIVRGVAVCEPSPRDNPNQPQG